MAAPLVTTLGVVLAGGRGERLGRGPKALVSLGGSTLLERSLATLAPLCERIVVTAPADLALASPALEAGSIEGREVTRVDDPALAAGPLAGLVAGLTASPFRLALALGADFPLVRTSFLAALLERLEPQGKRGPRPSAVVPAPNGILQPLVAAYPSAAASRLAAQLERGERAATRAVAALGPCLLSDPELERLPGGLENVFNLNTPADLAVAEERLGARRASA